jgi:hypothetical protein
MKFSKGPVAALLLAAIPDRSSKPDKESSKWLEAAAKFEKSNHIMLVVAERR